MISNPSYGWCKFQLDNFTGNPSYLTNVPLDMLDAFIAFWTETATLSVFFDEEGTEFTLVINPFSIYIIEEKEEPKLITINNNVENLTLELIGDIEKDIDGWSYFITNDEEDEIINQRNELISKLLALKAIVKKKNIKYIDLSQKK